MESNPPQGETYTFEKYTNKIKGWRKRIFTLNSDDVTYTKPNKDEVLERHHLSQMSYISIVKPNNFLLLKIISPPNNELMIRSLSNSDNRELYKIKNRLNAYKLVFHMNIVRYLYDNSLESNLNIKELEVNIQQYSTNKYYDNMLVLVEENRKKIEETSLKIKTKYNELVVKMNEVLKGKQINSLMEPMDENDFVFKEDRDSMPQMKNLFDFSSIEKLKKVNKILLDIFMDFKKREVYQKYLVKPKLVTNPLSDEQYEQKKKRITDDNNAMKSKLVELLNKNTAIKEKFKRTMKFKSLKLYFCPTCNNLLQKTLPTESNCNFDEDCTKRSLFFCRKCQTNYCTTCVLYQRHLKCFRNHSYFPNNTTREKYECLICECDQNQNQPFFACEFCNEFLCNQCVGDLSGKTYTCYNCNYELTWRRRVYAQCNKCMKWKDCYWCCAMCDYIMCLDCYALPRGTCGSFHQIKMIELDKERKERVLNKSIMFKNNFEMSLLGKCSKCNKTFNLKEGGEEQGTIIFACLRCKLFLCEECNREINE